MTFKYPIVFALFVPIALFFWRAMQDRWNQKKIFYPLAGRDFSKVAIKFNLELVLWFLKFLVCVCLVFALARPQTSSTSTKRSANGIDIMLALDVSKSMMIEDTRDRSRLDIAKETVADFIRGRKDDRIGLLVFSGESATLCPPTLDYEVLLTALSGVTTDQLKDGTAIGDGIANSVNRLRDSKAKTKIIILLTDGENNMGSVAPISAGDIAAGYGIKVYSIAFGKEGTVYLPQETDFFGQKRKQYIQLSNSINPELLQKISAETKGKFFRAAEEKGLAAVFKEIDRLEKTKVETKERVHWEEHFQRVLFLALILLLLEYALSRTVLRVLPN